MPAILPFWFLPSQFVQHHFFFLSKIIFKTWHVVRVNQSFAHDIVYCVPYWKWHVVHNESDFHLWFCELDIFCTHTHKHPQLHARTHTRKQKSIFFPSQLDSHDKRFWKKLGKMKLNAPGKSVFCTSQLGSHDKHFWRKLGKMKLNDPGKSEI